MWCYVLEELKIKLEFTLSAQHMRNAAPVRMRHVLEMYKLLYPYMSLEQLGYDLYKQQVSTQTLSFAQCPYFL